LPRLRIERTNVCRKVVNEKDPAAANFCTWDDAGLRAAAKFFGMAMKEGGGFT
jgi:hypothetical protein